MSKLTRMREGGLIHGQIRRSIYDFVQVGTSPHAIEAQTLTLIKNYGVEPSFTKVPNYHWATCINLNDSTVHGIPTSQTPLSDGDLVTVDLGIYYQGYHLDGAFTKVVGHSTPDKDNFLTGGLCALYAGIKSIKPGNRVGDISSAVQETLSHYNLSAFPELTGHGVGRDLHEEPAIPNVLQVKISSTPQLVIGQTLAIEVIYTAGKPQLLLEEDGWTISTKDGKLSGVFEETVEVTSDGCSVLTQPTLSQIPISGRMQP